MTCQREVAAERNQWWHDECESPGFAPPEEAKSYGRQPQSDLKL